MGNTCSINDEQRQKAIAREKSRLATLQSLGHDVDDALDTLYAIEKNINNEIKVKNLAKKHEKQFTPINQNRINKMNSESPKVGKAPVTIESGYKDVAGNIKYDVKFKGKDESYTFGSEHINLNQDDATFFSKDEIEVTDEHEQLKKDIWENPDEAIKLFDELVEIDGGATKHSAYLKDLLYEIMDDTTPILNEFKVYINKKADANKGMAQVVKGDSKIVLDITENSNTVSGDMTAAETYLHEMIHMSVEMGRQYSKGKIASITNELNVLHSQAKKKIKWQDLVVDGDKQQAKDLWKKLFNEKSSLSEFIAFGMTNENMKELLSNIDAADPKVSIKTKTLFGQISNWVNELYQAIRDLVSSDRGFSSDERLEWLTSKLWENNSQTIDNNSLNGKISKYSEDLRLMMDDMIKTGAGFVAKHGGKGYNWLLEANRTYNKDTERYDYNNVGQALDIAKNLTSLFNPFMSDMKASARNKTFTKISELMDGEGNWLGLGGIFAPEGTIMSIANYLRKDDKLTTIVEKFGLMVSKLDSNRTEATIAVGSVIKKALGKDVTPKEQVALSEILVELDMQSLEGAYTIDDMKDLLTDNDALDSAIEQERLNFDKVIFNKSLRNYAKSQSIGIGHYLATGITGKSIQRTARDVLYMTNLESLKDDIALPDAAKREKAIIIIDRMATLEGIKQSKPSRKKMVSKIIKSSPEGAVTILGMHKLYVKEAKEFAKSRKKNIYPHKGEIKDTSEPGMQSKVNYGDDETIAVMKDLGYKIKEETAVKGLFLYTSSIKGMPAYEKQAVAKINEGKRLHNIIGVINGNKNRKQLELEKEAWEYDTEEEYAAAVEQLRKDQILEDSKYKNKAESEIDTILDQAMDESIKQLEGIVTPIYDGYIPMYNSTMGITNYGVSVDKTKYANAMRQDNKVPVLMGKMLAEISEKKQAMVLNNMVYSTILEDSKNYTRGSVNNVNDYIEIGPDAVAKGATEKSYSETLFTNMPQNIRDRILARGEGQKLIAVRRDLAPMYFGSRSPSILEIKIPGTKGKTVKNLLSPYKYGPAITNTVALMGEIWSEIVSMQKVDIVIKTPGVLIGNIVSNFSYSVALGQAPWTVAKRQTEMFWSTKRYLDKSKELKELEIKSTAIKDFKGKSNTKQRIKELKRELVSEPVHDLMEAGLFTSIIEDVSDADLKAKSKLTHLIESNKTTKGLMKGTPKLIKDGVNTLYMNENSGMFKMLMMATQYSDFVARANRYHYLIEEKNYPKSTAIKMVLDEFVNYNRIDSPLIKWLNELGFAWFTKYFFGANKSLINKIKDRPSSIIAMSALLDVSNPSDASFFEKDYSYAVNGPLDTLWSGTGQHIMPPSALEVIGAWD